MRHVAETGVGLVAGIDVGRDLVSASEVGDKEEKDKSKRNWHSHKMKEIRYGAPVQKRATDTK